jgi:hypothetical protein
MNVDFLPRAHSRRLGELERSNWKSLETESDLGRIDPAIRDIILLLNRKGYTTFSSCSGGHKTNPRWRVNRHESGYIAFSPPSNVAFKLYFALRRKNRDFAFEAQTVVDNGDGGVRETICSRIYWQLSDQRKPKLQYYDKLFSQMKLVIAGLPRSPREAGETLKHLLGPSHEAGLQIINRQMKRFSTS